jgi:hypothetical protein
MLLFLALLEPEKGFFVSAHKSWASFPEGTRIAGKARQPNLPASLRDSTDYAR